ncbi:proteophosphoglycan ppg4 [Strigomonas culicis]|uniref:Proteophosphoglycan ppg4 n=1 Tax=Strigomonas culicis TaxID=28005 RepID=S9TNR0_9TRYP|nr:proteophosphoglycan ppg4 [Strigomonas culicis]|eukprot:EPY18349.1 proteophosphoglycan ppg4 [Strigomonas culicis]
MFLYSTNEVVEVPKPVTECNLTDGSQRDGRTESGGPSSDPSRPAVAMQPAGERKPLPPPYREWLNYPLPAETDGKAPAAAPLGADAAGAAAKDVRRPRAGTEPPAEAAALLQKRLSQARPGGAAPPALWVPKSAPPATHGGAQAASPIIRNGVAPSSDGSGTTSASHAADTVANHAAGGTNASPIKGSGTGKTAAATSGGGGGAALPVGSVAPSGSAAKRGATNPSAGRGGAAEGPALPLLSPQGDYMLTVGAASPDVSAESNSVNLNMKSVHSKERKAAPSLRSLFSRLEQPPGSPPVSATLRYVGPTSLKSKSLRRQNSASRSMLHALQSFTSCNTLPSMSIYDTTAVPHPEKKESGDQLALLAPGIATHTADGAAGADDAWEDMEEEDFYTAKKARANGLKRDFSFYGDETGLPGLWRTHSLFPDMFAAITKDANDAPDTDAAPGTTGPMARALSTFSFGAAVLQGGGTCQELYSDDSSESSTASGAAADTRTAPADAAPQPPATAQAAAYQRPAVSLSDPPPPLLPVPPQTAAASPGRLPFRESSGTTAVSQQEPVCGSPLWSDDAGAPSVADSFGAAAAPPTRIMTLRRRYMAPQPLLCGPPLRARRKVDSRLVFGGDFLAEAPWVSSPCDVDLDSDAAMFYNFNNFPFAPTAPSVPLVDGDLQSQAADLEEFLNEQPDRSEDDDSPVKKKAHKKGAIKKFFVRKMRL